MMKIKVSDYIAEFLKAQNTYHVFEVAGGMIAHLLDSFYRCKSTTIVSVHHEQAAAFAVDAYGRITGRPSVALATSGPGATNLLTGIASCYFDSSPALFITGQVNLHEQKGSKNIRQLGFQETDIVSMAKVITKKSFRVESPDQIVQILSEAYLLAMSGRPGPVLIDIPMNIQRAEIDFIAPIQILPQSIVLSHQFKSNIDLLLASLVSAQKPLLLVGGGVNSARARTQLLEFIKITEIPVVTSLMGLDLISYDDPLRVGFIGSYGNRWANIALGTTDCLIVLGSRLDIRQTGADVAQFSANKQIFHIDCDEGEINNRIKNCIPIVSDLKDFFEEANKKAVLLKWPAYAGWKEEISQLKMKWPDIKELGDIEGINPNHFFHALSNLSSPTIGYVADVGAHQMWAAQSLELYDEQFFITSGGMGAMGFSLPAAIGASLARDKKPVVVIVGDGSLQMNIQELQTVVRNKIPLKIIVINNQSLGMITQFQDSYFEGRYQSTYWGYDAPNFSAVSIAYGIKAQKISAENEISPALKWLWEDPESPTLLEVMIQTHLPVYPKIAFGKPITEMEPFAKPIEMEGT
jgi:acetolactate synthase-1/2/3 large subunit